MGMRYESRQDAGRKLGEHLAGLSVEADIVAGLPRGGVLVAAGVAEVLQLPLAAIVTRKIGHPFQPEFALGAIAENGIRLLDRAAGGDDPLFRNRLDAVLAGELERLKQQERLFHPGNTHPNYAGRRVLIVDDGLATGATAAAAVMSAKSRRAARVCVAAPVASDSALHRLARLADAVYVPCVDPEFLSVGWYYREFPQATDEEVTRCLGRAAAGA
jgi:putative phosphoribosyl transferase